ncbi:MAG: SCO family protein, partial [Parafilimonas terrae]|nr:SCO family protein [Parafilimonas terrae]
FKSRYDVQLKQFLHPAGIVALTAEGLVSRYVLGVGYRAGDVRAAIATASTGGIAKAALPILLLCFHYDEATGRYSLAIMKVLRLAGALTILVMGTVLIMAFRRNRRA